MEYRKRSTGRRERRYGTVEWVPLRSISPYLMKAVLIAEDDKFWSHTASNGGDPEGPREEPGGGKVQTRRQHDQPAAHEEPLPHALQEPRSQAQGGDHHLEAREGPLKAEDPRALPQRRRMGRGRLRRRGRREAPLRQARLGAHRGRGGQARSGPAQPQTLPRGRDLPLRRTPREDHLHHHGKKGHSRPRLRRSDNHPPETVDETSPPAGTGQANSATRPPTSAQRAKAKGKTLKNLASARSSHSLLLKPQVAEKNSAGFRSFQNRPALNSVCDEEEKLVSGGGDGVMGCMGGTGSMGGLRMEYRT
jgi:hypothetical protein